MNARFLLTLTLTVLIAAPSLGGCASSGGGRAGFGIKEELEIKRELLIEHGRQLTPEQAFVFERTRFQSEDEARDLMSRFLEVNQQRAEMDPDAPSRASDVLLRQAAE